MKTRFLVWGMFLLVVPIQIVATQAALEQAWNCADKNPLLAKLGAKGVILRPIVYATNKMCNQEWNKYGSCCDIDSTQDFIHSRQEANKLALADMVSEIESLDKNLEVFLQKSLGDIKLPASYDASDPHSSLEKVDRLYEDRSLPHLKAATVELIKLLASWETTMVADKQACMKELNKVLYAGTCSICSGRSEQFFQGGRIKMAEHTCRGILSECGSTWHRMVMVIEIIEKFTTIIDLVSPNAARNHKKGSFTKSMSAFSNLHNLQKYFGDCKRYEDCDFREVSALCETFVTVVGDSLLEKSTTEAIPKLTGSPVIPAAEVKKLDNLLNFVVAATSKMIAQVEKNQVANKANPFFKEVMSFGTLMQYLGKLKRSIFDTRFAVLNAYKNNKIGFEASLVKTLEKCNSLLKKINEYLDLVEKKKEEIQTYLDKQNHKVKADIERREHEYKREVSRPPPALVYQLAKPITVVKKPTTTIVASKNSTFLSNLFSTLSQANQKAGSKSNSTLLNIFSNIGWAIGNLHKAATAKTNSSSLISSGASSSPISDIANKIKESLSKIASLASNGTTTKPTTTSPVLTWQQKLLELKSAVSTKVTDLKQIVKTVSSKITAKPNTTKPVASVPKPQLSPTSQPSKPTTSSTAKLQPTSGPSSSSSAPSGSTPIVSKPAAPVWSSYKPVPSPTLHKPAAVHHKPSTAPAPVYHKPAPAPAPVYHKPAPAPAPVYHRPAPVYHKPAPAPAPVYHRPAPVYHKPAPAPVYHHPAPAPAPAYHRPAPSAPAPRPSWNRKLFMLANSASLPTSASEIQVVRDGDLTTVAPFEAFNWP